MQNQSGWQSDGFALLLGLLSVQWTMTDYDATAHISEEVEKASIRAPVAVVIAVFGTGICGWIYNIVRCSCLPPLLRHTSLTRLTLRQVYVLCSGPLDELPGLSGYSAATISES